MDFWERVEKEVLLQNCTFRWIAEKVVHRREQTISSWRSNNTLPRADDAVKIAVALGTTVEELVTGKERKAYAPPRRIAAIVADLEALDDAGLAAVALMIHPMAECAKLRNRSQEEDTG